jgi:hypothetical protein
LSQESRLICCIKINLILPTIISWCSTSNVTQYVYQTPSGDVLIVVKNVYYLIDFPSFNVKSGYNGQSIENLGIPKEKRIYAIFRTYSGKTYIYIL